MYLGSTTDCVSRVHISKAIPKGKSGEQQSVSRSCNSLCIQGTNLQGKTIRRDQGTTYVSRINKLCIQGTHLQGNTKRIYNSLSIQGKHLQGSTIRREMGTTMCI